MSKARDKAKVYLSPIPLTGRLSTRDNQKAFDGLVGAAPPPYESRHKQMEATNWRMTFCNEFAGEFGRFVTGTYMGAINLEKFILGGKHAHAWVSSASGATPQYGDIFFTTSPHQHLGVSRGVVGGRHLKTEAGLGGVNYKMDMLGHTETPWNSGDYVGWVDIDLFVNGPPRDEAAVQTVVGKWTVWGDRRRYRWTYTFNESGAVRWMDVFNGMNGGGKWSLEGQNLRIVWSSGSTDLWTGPVNAAKMTGYEDMKGEGRIDIEASKQTS